MSMSSLRVGCLIVPFNGLLIQRVFIFFLICTEFSLVEGATHQEEGMFYRDKMELLKQNDSNESAVSLIIFVTLFSM